MKLIVQIPCFNEQDTLQAVLEDIPRTIEGVDTVAVLVIDDGSTDATVAVAEKYGADHVLRLNQNKGLAYAFAQGLSTALGLGAEIIVNTDGDHQYCGEDIPALLAPILRGEADIVVGDRQVRTISHFSPTKKLLQRLGTAVVRWASGTAVADATSGFRALTRDAAQRLMVHSSYTYTLDTIIQAGKKGMTVGSVPVGVNPATRPSRLIRNTPRYVLQSAVTILRIFLMYEALKTFTAISVIPFVASVVLFARYAIFFLSGQGAGHVQSVIVASVLGLLAFQVFLLGLLADLIARNRRIAEELLLQVRKGELERR